MSDDNAKLRTAYVQAWKRILPVFFDWPEESVDVWVAPAYRRMGAKFTSFYHEDPIFYVLPLLVPDRLKMRLRPDALTSLEAELHTTITRSTKTWRNADFDWIGARKRVKDVLKKHGEQLPARFAPSDSRATPRPIRGRSVNSEHAETPLLLNT